MNIFLEQKELCSLGGLAKWLDDGKTYSPSSRTGERVYGTIGVAVSVTANGGGLAGSGGGLYLVRRNGR